MKIDENTAFELIGSEGEYFKNRDRNSIYYYRIGSGSQPMLFLHTLRTQAEFHHKLLPAFIEEYDCYVIDWPGHGRSSKDPNVNYSADYLLRQVIEFIQAKDLRDLTVVGESIGGTGALALAARIPERVRSVIASNPYDEGMIIGKPVGSVVSWLGGKFSFVTKDEVRPITQYLIGGGFSDRSKLEDRFVDLISDAAKEDEQFGAAFHSVLANQKSWHEIRINDYPRIPKEVQVILHYGQHDWSAKWVRKENAEKLGGDLRVVTTLNAGHFSFLENPAVIIDLIKESTLAPV